MDGVLGSPQNLKKVKYTSLLKYILNWCPCVSAQTNAGAWKDYKRSLALLELEVQGVCTQVKLLDLGARN